MSKYHINLANGNDFYEFWIHNIVSKLTYSRLRKIIIFEFNFGRYGNFVKKASIILLKSS